MRILGIDPALAVTGYGVIESLEGRSKLIASGTIETRAKDAMPARLSMIYEAMITVIRTHKPGVMAVEKVFVHGQHPLTACVLGQARGVICLAAHISGVTVEEYAATQIKKSIAGTGQASKEQIRRMIVGLLRLDGTPARLDVTDALAAALTHSYCSRRQEQLFSRV